MLFEEFGNWPNVSCENLQAIKLFFFFACLFFFQSQVFPIMVVTKKIAVHFKEMADIVKELNHGSSGRLETASFT